MARGGYLLVGILCGIAICSACRIAVGIWDTPPRSLLCKARISVRNEYDAPIAYPIARVSGTPILQVGNEAGEIEMTVPKGATISFLLPGSMFHRYQPMTSRFPIRPPCSAASSHDV